VPNQKVYLKLPMQTEFLFDELLPAGATDGLKQLTGVWDSFNSGLKQLVAFQFTLHGAIRELSTHYLSLKTEVEMIGRQLFTIDEVVQSYFDRNPIQVYTRDG
jgi:hypothetical protein